MVDKIKYLSETQKINTSLIDQESLEEELLEQAVLRLNGSILGIVLGILCGLIIFIATNWLIIKGGPNVGSHLNLLSQFFVGYSVTFSGSIVGLIYGFVTGFIGGFIIALIYNRIVMLRNQFSKN